MAKVKPRVLSGITLVAGRVVPVRKPGSVPKVGRKPVVQLNGLHLHNDQLPVVGSVRPKTLALHGLVMEVVAPRSAVARQVVAPRSGMAHQATVVPRSGVVRRAMAVHRSAVVRRVVADRSSAVAVVSNNVPAAAVGRVPLAGYKIVAVGRKIVVPAVAVVRRTGKTGTARSAIGVGKQGSSATPLHKRYARRCVRVVRLNCHR